MSRLIIMARRSRRLRRTRHKNKRSRRHRGGGGFGSLNERNAEIAQANANAKAANAKAEFDAEVKARFDGAVKYIGADLDAHAKFRGVTKAEFLAGVEQRVREDIIRERKKRNRNFEDKEMRAQLGRLHTMTPDEQNQVMQLQDVMMRLRAEEDARAKAEYMHTEGNPYYRKMRPDPEPERQRLAAIAAAEAAEAARQAELQRLANMEAARQAAAAEFQRLARLEAPKLNGGPDPRIEQMAAERQRLDAEYAAHLAAEAARQAEQQRLADEAAGARIEGRAGRTFPLGRGRARRPSGGE